jgi:hypothetical protein
MLILLESTYSIGVIGTLMVLRLIIYKEANIKTLLSTSLEFQRDGMLLNAIPTM